MKRGLDSEVRAFKEAQKTRSQIKGWLVAALAAAVFAIAPMYYGLFATLDGPANREKWFTPERQKDFDAWSCLCWCFLRSSSLGFWGICCACRFFCEGG